MKTIMGRVYANHSCIIIFVFRFTKKKKKKGFEIKI